MLKRHSTHRSASLWRPMGGASASARSGTRRCINKLYPGMMSLLLTGLLTLILEDLKSQTYSTIKELFMHFKKLINLVG